MALQPSLHRFKINLSQVDRGSYAQLDVRVARQPSETERNTWARVLAFCLFHEEGLEFSAQGIADPDTPSIFHRQGDGVMTRWIEVGTPSGERIHKASKACPKVAVVVAVDPGPWLKELRGSRIHKAESVEVWALDPSWVAALRPLDRQQDLDVTVSEGVIYLEHNGESVSTEPTRLSLAAQD